MTSLVWCGRTTKDSNCGLILSSNVDGTVSQWDLFLLKQKVIYFSVYHFFYETLYFYRILLTLLLIHWLFSSLIAGNAKFIGIFNLANGYGAIAD